MVATPGAGGSGYTVKMEDAQVQRAFRALLAESGDARPCFRSIESDWYKTNKMIFTLKGPGQYADLSAGYKKAKMRFMGTQTPYPILRAKTGSIEAGLTDKGSPYTVREMTRKTLTLGIQGKNYFPFQQAGSHKHPFIFNSTVTGSGPFGSAESQTDIQMKRWTNIFVETLKRRMTKRSN
jgi:hypothetical protein